MIEILLTACVLLLVLVAGGLYLLHERIRKKLRDFETRFIRADLQMQWRHTSSLAALYRIMDGKDWLPDIRGTDLPPDFLLHVAVHVQRHSPRTIIECGCGVSTVIIASVFEKAGIAGHVYSIEEHPQIAAETLQELRRRNLDRYVTIANIPLIERRYPGIDATFHWYDLKLARPPGDADMLLVAGPRSQITRNSHLPAGIELMPSLSRGAHIFVASADDPNELKVQWRALYPHLGILELAPEAGGFEMYFLDHKIRDYMPDIRQTAHSFD
jgi:hypothetical protein